MARPRIARQRLAGALCLALGSALLLFTLTSVPGGDGTRLTDAPSAGPTEPTVRGMTVQRRAPEASAATPATLTDDSAATVDTEVTSTTGRPQPRVLTTSGSMAGSTTPTGAPSSTPPPVETDPTTTAAPTSTAAPTTTTTDAPTTTTEPATTTSSEPPPA